jgi:hypothetical protein
MAGGFDLSKIFQFNRWAKIFRATRPEEEAVKDKQEIANSVGVSQEQVDLYNYINYDYLMSPGSAVTYIGIAFEQYFANKQGRIQKYREMALYSEVADGLDQVCDEAIVADKSGEVVTLEINEEMPTHIEEEIRKIWDYLLVDVFSFKERGWDLFRKWLTEAELYVELILNDEGNNIVGIKILPSHTLMPIYEENKIVGYMQTKVGNPTSQDVRLQQQGSIVFDKDQVAYSNYGIYGANFLDVRGYLESAIRIYNQLKNMEDALVVYRLVRAPERRVWNIAIGRMPKGKAEEYVRGLIQRYKKKIIYNADTGEVDSTQNVQSLTEDFWFTRNENGEGTTVETIGGAMNLGELNDINYFLQKLYKTLKLPKSRWDDSTPGSYSSGKSGEILREELKFGRFVERLQNRFKYILLNPFLTLLRLKGIDDRYIDENIFNIKFTRANLFKEYREMELTEARLAILQTVDPFIFNKTENPKGVFSREFAMKHFVLITDEEWNTNAELLEKEIAQSPAVEQPGSAGAEAGFGGEEAGGAEAGLGGGGMGGGGFGGLGGGAEAGGMEAGAAPEAGGAEAGAAPAPEAGGGAAPVPAVPESVMRKKTGGKTTNNLFESWQLEDSTIKNRFKNIRNIL